MKIQAATIALTALSALSVSSVAQAHVAATDPGIFSPFDNAQVEVTWLGSDAGYTGNLNWLDPNILNTPTTLWNNKNATMNQSSMLPVILSQGQRLDFEYEIIVGGLDLFSMAQERDWDQFRVTEVDPSNFLVYIEDIRLPGGDADYNDAMFGVRFTPAVPAPGAMALMGMGAVLAGRRRRA